MNFRNCSRKKKLSPQITILSNKLGGMIHWEEASKICLIKSLLCPIVSECPSEHLFTKSLLRFIFVWIAFHSFEVSNSYLLLLSSGWHIYPILPVFKISPPVWIPHMCKIKFDFFFPVNLSHSIWFLVWLKGPYREQEILPTQQVSIVERINNFLSYRMYI